MQQLKQSFLQAKMTYEETLEYLYKQTPAFQKVGASAYKPGLDNSLRLDAYFGKPHRKYRTIHVGGTNGKGSTSHLLAAILQQAGYKTGLYTSPHLADFRERIRVNGRMIEKSFVIDFVERHRSEYEAIQPSFFELTMEMAFVYFAKQNIDVAIIEVGMGGRLDSTNIITPDVSIITNIGMDHTQFLGDTTSKIAMEKAGIIKQETPVIIGEIEDEDVRKVFTEKAHDMNAPLYFAETEMVNITTTLTDSGNWKISAKEYPNLICSLGGFAQQRNIKTVLTAIKVLRTKGYSISDVAVHGGFANVVELTGLQGRWQQLSERPRIVCDTAHNAHGIRYVAKQLKNEKFNHLHIVWGMTNEKEPLSILSLLPKDATYYFARASVERSQNEHLLKQKALSISLNGNAYPSVADALTAAQKNAKTNDLIFIGGSNFIVADALIAFDNQKKLT